MSRSERETDWHSTLVSRLSFLGSLPVVGRLWARLESNPRELVRFLKFSIVGTVGAGVDFAVLNLMKLLFEGVGLGEGWNLVLDTHQIQSAAANVISFTAAVLSNFTWNRLWTFPESRERPVQSQLLQFSLVNVIGLGINTVLLLVMDRYVFGQFAGPRLSLNLAKAFAIGVVLFWNFGINRIWTYRGIE